MMDPRVEEILSKIARQIMALDDEALDCLLPKYRKRMLSFAPTRAWEESMIIYFIINGLRVKNIQFNDKIKDYMVTGSDGKKKGPHVRPRLRLVPWQNNSTCLAQNIEEVNNDED